MFIICWLHIFHFEILETQCTPPFLHTYTQNAQLATFNPHMDIHNAQGTQLKKHHLDFNLNNFFMNKFKFPLTNMNNLFN
jgi:hypothetical protein